jgi:hypothetical protein
VLQLRLGRTEDALESLRRAYIDDRPEAAREYGRMAVVLEEHGQIHAAADAISLESPERFRSPTGSIWAPVYSRLMTAAGRWDEALDVLVGLDELNWTRAMGEAAARYLVPEDRQALRNALNARRLDASPAVRLRLTEVARSGGLHDLEAEWLLADAADAARRAGPGTGQLTEASLLADLERRRMRYSDLGQRLEDLAAAAPANLRNGLLTQAQGVWRAIGDTEAELRLFETASPLQVANRSRYYELLAETKHAIFARVDIDPFEFAS